MNALQRAYGREAAIVAMYNGAASSWDAGLRRIGYHRAYRVLFRSLRQSGTLQSLSSGGHVLDCGVGTAALSIALAHTITLPLQLQGADIASGMLHQARGRLDRAGVEAQLYEADAACLPFQSNAFDLVMSGHMLEYAAEPPQVIEEMVRVLKPNAPLLVVVTHRGLLDWLIRRRWHYTLRAPEHIISWFTGAGLTHVRRYPVGEPTSLAATLGTAYIGFKRIQPRFHSAMT